MKMETYLSLQGVLSFATEVKRKPLKEWSGGSSLPSVQTKLSSQLMIFTVPSKVNIIIIIFLFPCRIRVQRLCCHCKKIPKSLETAKIEEVLRSSKLLM